MSKSKILTCPRHGETPFAWRSHAKRWRCRRCEYEAFHRRRVRVKARLVEHFGGKCQDCGYDRCLAALSFHHRDPTSKQFGLAIKSTVGWDRLIAEAAKCDLICMNCHAERHAAERANGGHNSTVESRPDKAFVPGSSPGDPTNFVPLPPPAQKLDAAQVMELRAKRLSGVPARDLAAQYNIHVKSVSRIVSGRARADVPLAQPLFDLDHT